MSGTLRLVPGLWLVRSLRAFDGPDRATERIPTLDSKPSRRERCGLSPVSVVEQPDCAEVPKSALDCVWGNAVPGAGLVWRQQESVGERERDQEDALRWEAKAAVEASAPIRVGQLEIVAFGSGLRGRGNSGVVIRKAGAILSKQMEALPAPMSVPRAVSDRIPGEVRSDCAPPPRNLAGRMRSPYVPALSDRFRSGRVP